MSMKITDLYKNQMLRTSGQMKHETRAERTGNAGGSLSRKEQRKLDQAAGLVPFACKLPGDLVKTLNGEAAARKQGMNELVADLLKKGLA